MMSTTAIDRSDSSLTSGQRRELAAELRRELATLDRRLRLVLADDLDESPDLVLHADAALDDRTSALDERRDALVRALTRIAHGQYGVCLRCTAPIPYGRLLVMPDTMHCLACHARA